MDLRHRVYLEANFSGPDCAGILPKFCQNFQAIPKTVSQTVSHRADRSPKSLLHSQFGLEAEVGIAPRLPSPAKNSAALAAWSITILHYPPVSPTLILLKLLLNGFQRRGFKNLSSHTSTGFARNTHFERFATLRALRAERLPRPKW